MVANPSSFTRRAQFRLDVAGRKTGTRLSSPTLRFLKADFLYAVFFLELVSLSPSAMQAPLLPLAAPFAIVVALK